MCVPRMFEMGIKKVEIGDSSKAIFNSKSQLNLTFASFIQLHVARSA